MQAPLHANHANQNSRGPLPHCVLISTGGTIASRIDPQTGLALPVLSGEDLLSTLPELAGIADVQIEDLSRIPSPHIAPEHWIALHQRISELLAQEHIAGIVVTHGTGTLEETAWFLDLTLDSKKPVVLVGAQRNGSEQGYDGPRNLLDAFRICVCPESHGKGVLVALNQHINTARDVAKTHTFDVETFNSGEWGYIGNVTIDRVNFHRQPLRRLHIPVGASAMPRVDVVSMYPGATGALVQAAIDDGAHGLVIQAVGSGHVNPAMYAAVQKAIAQGIPIVVSTRVAKGGTRACYGFEGSSQLLQNAGAVLAGELSAWKARVVLMLAIQNGTSSADAMPAYFQA